MSYVPTPAQAPTPQASGSRSGMKILTIIGACLAILFLILSVVLGLGARSTHQAARQAQSDAQSLRDQAKETETETATTRTKITEATNKKEAQAWCDGLTSANADFDSLDAKAREYKSLTATRHEHPHLLGGGILGDNHRIRIRYRNEPGGPLGVRRRRRVLPRPRLYHQGLSALGQADGHRPRGRISLADIDCAVALLRLGILHRPRCQHLAQRGLSR